MHISPYSGASTHEALDPVRPRKLLLHRKEIEQIAAATQQKGKTLVPLRVYFTHGIAKIELGVADGQAELRQTPRRSPSATRSARWRGPRGRRQKGR